LTPCRPTGHAAATRECRQPSPGKSPGFKQSGCYGLLAIGNGHAPGTAIGLGAAGIETTATGFGAKRLWEAGLAVFFFAAFLTAGFLAGFFLAAGFLALAFAGTLRLEAVLRMADFRDAFAADFFLRAIGLLTTFFFADFLFADFFLLAIRASVF